MKVNFCAIAATCWLVTEAPGDVLWMAGKGDHFRIYAKTDGTTDYSYTYQVNCDNGVRHHTSKYVFQVDFYQTQDPNCASALAL